MKYKKITNEINILLNDLLINDKKNNKSIFFQK